MMAHMKSQTFEQNNVFDDLVNELSNLPYPEQTIQSLHLASKLIEQAAYAFAKHKSGSEVVQMLLIAADVERVRDRHINLSTNNVQYV